jgi:hypothetical protein
MSQTVRTAPLTGAEYLETLRDGRSVCDLDGWTRDARIDDRPL